MLEWLGIIVFIGLILVFFYRQAIHEFRINQANATQRSEILELWKERVPLVIRELPRMSLWTREDIMERACYEQVALFKDQSLAEWIRSVSLLSGAGGVDGEGGKSEIRCPWYSPQAERIAGVTGISIWAERYLHPLMGSFWYMARYHSWAGSVGVHRTYASWTCILPVEGELVVTIFPGSMEPYLPVEWRGTFPSEWTKRDTPFAADIKYMDIVVRPGTCLFLPPHWFVSWSSATLSMVYTISYHTPISLIAFRLAEAEANRQGLSNKTNFYK
jgi:hypothetical protein